MESRLAAGGPVRTSAASGTGEAVPIRVAAPRLGNAPPSSTRRPDVNPRERPSNRRQIASHVRKPRRLCPIPYRTPPPLRSETRPGAPWTRRVARRRAASKGRDTFRVLRPMRSAREQREKLPSGDFYNHARLRFLPCRHARAACDSRGARHATGAGLRV